MSEYIRKPNSLCKICGKPVYRRPGVLQKSGGVAYCGQVCYGKSTRKEKPCVVCGSPILAGENKKTCNRACANRNRAGIHYTGKRLKDNVVTQRRLKERLFSLRGKKCERCGFSVYQVLEIHHQDRDRNNNTLGNLEIICPNCHAKEHYLKN